MLIPHINTGLSVLGNVLFFAQSNLPELCCCPDYFLIFLTCYSLLYFLHKDYIHHIASHGITLPVLLLAFISVDCY